MGRKPRSKRAQKELPLFDATCPKKQTLSESARVTGTRVEQAKRLSRQCESILARLRIGPASNSELAALSLKYTSRVSDLRAAGYDVRCVDRHSKSGVSYYQLFESQGGGSSDGPVSKPTGPS